ncbi:hypothetical protein CALVIDRAFT_601192 [Calocera viscosa TUFC12733]|uniref:Phytanoyl-CoA dioxygenase n=1 Tax=Calocera viscosa (strain TUFC12733) TaxID=1330018 RepID=A0A167ISZ3_CALVF|nr:hypothetical protein CALVIDRAFT_601192 [Calocera viscosa TUFC12733]
MPAITSHWFRVVRSFEMSTSQPVEIKVQSIKPSEEERKTGKLSEANLERAVKIMHEDGLLMIEDAVDPAHLDKLNERMTSDAFALWDGGFRKGPQETGNIQIDPPVEPALFFEDAFLNRLAVCVSTAYLGGKPRMTFSSGNAAMHGTASQEIHSDYGNFGKVPSRPFAVVVNTGLVAMNPANGSTELWLGTHILPRSTPEGDAQIVVSSEVEKVIQPAALKRRNAQAPSKGPLQPTIVVSSEVEKVIQPAALKRRNAQAPSKGPLQPTVPKDAIMLRDLRLWHGGKPNPTQEPRIMLAQIHFAPDYKNPMRLQMPRELKGVIEARKDIDVAVDWVDGKVDNLKSTTLHTFNFLDEERSKPFAEMTKGERERAALDEMAQGNWAAVSA